MNAESEVVDPAAPDCCSVFYEQEWVRELADNHFHPGGTELTRRTAGSMNLPPGARVLDLGCGTGTTALLLAREFDLDVTGIDIGAANVVRAGDRARQCPPRAGRVAFQQADARYLPFAGGGFDGVLAECAFSLFPEPAAVLAEVRRVLRPGGRLALTDMALCGELPPDLLEAASGWACLDNARSQRGWERLFEQEGFDVQRSVDESTGLEALLGQIKRRLLVAGAGALLADRLPAGLDLATLNRWLLRFGHEIQAGRIRYYRFLLNPVRPAAA